MRVGCSVAFGTGSWRASFAADLREVSSHFGLFRLICNSKLNWLLGGVCLKCSRRFNQEYNNASYAFPMSPNGVKYFETTRAYHLHVLLQWFSLLKKCHISVSICLASASVRRISVCLNSQHFRGIRKDHRLLNLQNLIWSMMGTDFHMLLLWLNTGRSWGVWK